MNDYVPRQPMPSANVFLVGVLILLSSVLAWQLLSPQGRGNDDGETVPTTRSTTPPGELQPHEKLTISVFKEASPSVVFIRTKGYQRYLLGVEEQELSSGTGFVWDREGHIITNLHVINDAMRSPDSKLEVQFADQSVVDAEIIGGVREYDIAVLKVDVSEDRLRPITLGTSGDLQKGQTVLAIGSPFGFDQTLSTGVIGGLDRSVATEDGDGILSGLIQTDAAINPGNSGGPLLDSSGRMIGVNTAIVSPTGAYSGLGFAVPVSGVIKSVEKVLVESQNPKPFLGISVLSPEYVENLGIPRAYSERGLFIKRLEPGSPADRANLRPTSQRGLRIYLGDQISAIGGKPISSLEQLQEILGTFQPGDQVTIEVWRGPQRGEVTVTLEKATLLF